MLFPVISAVFQVFFDSYRVLFTSSQAWWWYQASIPITSWIWTFFSTLHCSIFFMRFFHHKQKKTRCWTTRSEEYTMILRLSWFEFTNFSCFAYHEECVKSMFFHPCLILRALMKNVGVVDIFQWARVGPAEFSTFSKKKNRFQKHQMVVWTMSKRLIDDIAVCE